MPGLLFQPNVTPSTLADLSKVSPLHILQANDTVNRATQADEMALEDLPAAYQHQQTMRPLLQREMDTQNQMRLAQIPGMQADTRKRNIEADTAEKTQAAHIDDLFSKYGADKTKRYLDEIQNMGPLMSQAAALVGTNPVGGHLMAREMFHKAGHPELWSPMFDKMSPGMLADALLTKGKEVTASSQAYAKAFDTAQLKAEYQARLEAAKIASREQIATQRVGAAREMKNWELQNARFLDKPTYQSLGARYEEFARQAMEDEKPDEARKYTAEAKRLFTLAQQMPAVAPNIGNQGKVDVNALTNGAIPTLNPAREASVPGANYPDRVPAPAAKPATPEAAAKAGWQLHVDGSGNKAYVSPDGKNFVEVR